jgi:hypothetical protein
MDADGHRPNRLADWGPGDRRLSAEHHLVQRQAEPSSSSDICGCSPEQPCNCSDPWPLRPRGSASSATMSSSPAVERTNHRPWGRVSIIRNGMSRYRTLLSLGAVVLLVGLASLIATGALRPAPPPPRATPTVLATPLPFPVYKELTSPAFATSCAPPTRRRPRRRQRAWLISVCAESEHP